MPDKSNKLRCPVALFAACVVVAPCVASTRRHEGVCAPAASVPPQQTTGEGARASGQNTRKRGGQSAAARASAAREKQRAVSALLEAADAARVFDDRFYSAKVQALAADALWLADERAARALFRRAWEAATEADLAEMKEMAAESGEDGNSPHLFTDARDVVISAATRRDPRLGETFFGELMKSQSELGSDPRRSAQTSYAAGPSEGVSVEGWQRLQLAERLLAEGDPQRAAALAAPVVAEGPSIDLVHFLLELRAHAPTEADDLFLRLLQRMRGDASADSGDVLLLSSYILTPNLLTTIDSHGTVNFRNLSFKNPAAEPPPSPRVLVAFFDTAAGVLLRSAAPSPDADEVSAESKLLGLFFTTRRLLPFFEREAPRHAPQLHARLQSLAADIDAERRGHLSAQADVRKVTSNNSTDRLGPTLDAISKADEGPARDRLRLQAVHRAAELKMWERAQSFADSITQPEARRKALLLVTVYQLLSLRGAYAEGEEQDFELAASFVRGADAPPLALAFGMAQAAELAAKRNKPERANELLDQASAHAGRAAQGGEQRAVAFAVVAITAASIDAARAWDALSEFVRAANAFDEYVGDEISFRSDANSEVLDGDYLNAIRAQLSTFDLTKVFTTVARLDFGRALEQARALEGREARAFATVAAARARLERDTRGMRGAGEKQ
ncbi:MAG TPA: hypothetical protein VF240_11655 [Pyrinomonadaceae bacterium]